jgi:hypothetical protein
MREFFRAAIQLRAASRFANEKLTPPGLLSGRRILDDMQGRTTAQTRSREIGVAGELAQSMRSSFDAQRRKRHFA